MPLRQDEKDQGCGAKTLALCGLAKASRKGSMKGLKLPVNDEVPEEVLEIVQCLRLQENDYREIMNLLHKDMEKGLSKATHPTAMVKMFPSYVTKTPSGKEVGDVLALDLGGTNYRILLVSCRGHKQELSQKETDYAIPANKMHGTGEELFDYIVENLEDFLKSHHLKDKPLKLGFTFSFPCRQVGLSSAILIQWTKGFSATGVVGKDVAKMLQDALDRRKLKVKCVALVNDTVGTLAACALTEPKCAIGLIVGTGTNAAYIEKVEAVETYEGPKPESGEVIINMEWGGFGSDGSLKKFRSPWDDLLDKQSLHPGQQIFEKMISGLYLGEIVRLTLLELIEKKLLFGGNVPGSFATPGSFHTKYLSAIQSDPVGLFYATNYTLTEDMKVSAVQPLDSNIVRYVCELVVCRAAYLAGTGTACLLNRMNRKHVTVGIDGSLFKFHPKFSEYMTALIHRLKEPSVSFVLRLSEDGSGKGAAAIAISAAN